MKFTDIKMGLRRPTKADVLALFGMTAWGAWLWWVNQYTRDVYLLDDYITFIMPGIAAILGGYASWRVYLRERENESPGKLEKIKLLSGVFFAIFGAVTISLWKIPELIVVTTAHQRVSEVYTFRMAYPGPSCGKHCRCKAGVIYYDNDLKREIEFCQWDDASSFFYTDFMRVDKIISDKGVRVISHEAIH